jgi:hypothetical protein
MAAGIAVLLLIFLVVVINACETSKRKNALRDWNTQATQLISQSDTDVAAQFFDTVRQAGVSGTAAQDVQTSIASLREVADKNLASARKLDTPDELKSAQLSLLTALEFRRDALSYVAGRVTAALGSEGDAADQALEGIGGEMQAFLASDVLIRMRVTPLVASALKDNDVVADPARTKGSLPGFSWLNPSYFARQIGARLTTPQARQRNEPPAPGLHGDGLTGTSAGGTALTPGASGSNRVPVTDKFTVTFQNQGDNNETSIEVSVTLQGGTAKDIVGKTVVGAVAAGATGTAEITLPRKPVNQTVYTVNVLVGQVPGEKKLDNNKATYNVFFQ